MATAAKLDTIIPTGAPPDGQPERIAAAVTREAFAAVGRMGGNRGQWAAIMLTAAALVWHVMGDGTVRERSERTEALVGDTERRLATVEALVYWLAECEAARQDGSTPPRFPIPQRPTP